MTQRQILPNMAAAVLIDTWWNVNQSFGEEQLKEAFVLIDTWWNVNINFSGKMAQMSTVLIDTWWNVNLFTLPKLMLAGVF